MSEFSDRFDEYREDMEPVNREPWDRDGYDEPMSADEYMGMKLEEGER